MGGARIFMVGAVVQTRQIEFEGDFYLDAESACLARDIPDAPDKPLKSITFQPRGRKERKKEGNDFQNRALKRCFITGTSFLPSFLRTIIKGSNLSGASGRCGRKFLLDGAFGGRPDKKSYLAYLAHLDGSGAMISAVGLVKNSASAKTLYTPSGAFAHLLNKWTAALKIADREKARQTVFSFQCTLRHTNCIYF